MERLGQYVQDRKSQEMGVYKIHNHAIYVLSKVRKGEMIQELDIEGGELLIRTILFDYMFKTC